MPSDPLGVLVVGTGGIGDFHVRLWNEIPDARVVGVYDVKPEVAQAVAKKYDVPNAYPSLEAALADAKVAAVDVCTPNMFHKEGVVAALDAGKHVICEKPLAIEPADIEAMIAARDRSGKLLMTAQHMRFEPSTAALKRMIAGQRLGDVYYTRAWWLRRRMAPSSPGFLSRKQAGRGPGADIGVHVLDLAMHLLDNPRPISVSGYAATKLAHQADVCNQWGTFDPRDFEVEDFAAGLIRFENNTALSLEVSWLLNMSASEVIGVWLHGTKGGVQWPDLKLAHVQDGLLVDTQLATPLPRGGHKEELLAFQKAIQEGGPSPVPAEQSLQVARALEGLYESAEKGQEIRLA